MSNIDGLASQWLEVKALEKKIIAQRHAIEEQITAALEAKGEGSITHKLDEHKKMNTKGTGLGLSICKNIINKMGG